MFTGIIETIGVINTMEANGSNLLLWVESPISHELKPDQSVNHNGVCLTIEEVNGSAHRVTVIEETLKKTHFLQSKSGEQLNLERSLKLSDRLDGHLVQGHVDTTSECLRVTEKNGSWKYEFNFPKKFSKLVIEKGSICVNGVSLTAFDVTNKSFKVAIIPYTYQHTNLKNLNKGDLVNLEFDILGKYILRQKHLQN